MALKLYIAFTHEAARNLQGTTLIEPDDFGYPYRYIPCARTAPMAVHRAEQALGTETTLLVMELTFSAEKTSHAFQQEILCHDKKDYRYYGVIALDSEDVTIELFVSMINRMT